MAKKVKSEEDLGEITLYSRKYGCRLQILLNGALPIDHSLKNKLKIRFSRFSGVLAHYNPVPEECILKLQFRLELLKAWVS